MWVSWQITVTMIEIIQVVALVDGHQPDMAVNPALLCQLVRGKMNFLCTLRAWFYYNPKNIKYSSGFWSFCCSMGNATRSFHNHSSCCNIWQTPSCNFYVGFVEMICVQPCPLVPVCCPSAFIHKRLSLGKKYLHVCYMHDLATIDMEAFWKKGWGDMFDRMLLPYHCFFFNLLLHHRLHTSYSKKASFV